MALTQYTTLKLKNGKNVKLSVVSNSLYITNNNSEPYSNPFKAGSAGEIWGQLISKPTKLTLVNNGYIDLRSNRYYEAWFSAPHSVGTFIENYVSVSYLAGNIDGNDYLGYMGKYSDGTIQIRLVVNPKSNKWGNFLVDSFGTSNDPFDLNGGSSTAGGGGGNFDNTSQPVDFPDLPSLSAVDSGFVTVYNPNYTQLQELASFMWSTDFIDNVLKLWADPMDVILNLSMLPLSIPTLGSRDLKVGNVSTGVSVSVASTQFMYVDCGSINVNEYWGAYLDYSPYTKISIYLPYVGTHQLNIDDVMSKTVHVKYIVDILSGSCVAFVKCGESVLYSYSGNCATNIPVTSANYARSMQAILGSAGSVVGSAISGNGVGVATGIGGMAGAVMSAKPSVERSGNLSGNSGLLGHQYPYLILERPRQCVPESQNSFSGYPAYMTVSLSSVKGYTVVDSINLKNVNVTEQEKSELIEILKKGVYF